MSVFGLTLKASMKLLLLIDMVSTDRTRVYRTQYFPLVQALARQRGFEVHWLCVRVEAGGHEQRSGTANPFVFDLPDDDRQLLMERVRQLQPSHLLLNERLAPELWSELRQAAAGAQARRLSPPVEDWLWSPQWLGPARGQRRLVDLFTGAGQLTPDYHRQPLNHLARQIRSFTWLSVGPLCLFRSPLACNPAYAGVDLSACTSTRGCSFCTPSQGRRPGLQDVVAQALLQLQAAEDSTPEWCRWREYVISGAPLWARLDVFLDALLQRQLEPASLYFHCRADELLAMAPRIEARLPALAGAGHSLHVFSMGVENFSEAENQRFNKGLEARQVLAAARLMNDWERRFPETFCFSRHGGFSFILYTPWTTLADLRQNIRGLRQLRPLCQGVEFALRTRLQLLPGRAITELARDQGLLAEGMDDEHAVDSGCITDWDIQELPWRFAHQRTALLFRFSRRLVQDPAIPADEPQSQALRRWLEQHAPDRPDLLELFSRAEELVRRAPQLPTMEDLQEQLATSLANHRARAPLSLDLQDKGVQLCVRGPCDLACLFCNLRGDRPRLDSEQHFAELCEEIDWLARVGLRSASWGVYHHEPTTYERLPQLLQHATDRGIQQNRLITNGVRTADRDYLRQLKQAGLSSLSVTLVEFDEASADALCQGQGVLAARLQTFANCRELGLQLQPVVLLMRANYQRAEQILQLYGEYLDAPLLQLIQPTMEQRVSWFLPPLSGVLEVVCEAARARPQKPLTLLEIPRCVRLHQQIPANLRFRGSSQGVHFAACEGCPWRDDCGGFPEPYLQLYGDGEAAGELLHRPLSVDQLARRCQRHLAAAARTVQAPERPARPGERSSRRLLALVSRRLLQRPPEQLGGLRVEQVELSHHQRVVVTLSHGGARFSLLVAWSQKADKALIRAGPLALMVPTGEPLDTLRLLATRQVARALLQGKPGRSG